MDNITHSLTGVALARAGLDRFSPHATFLLILSANAPDVDIVATSRGGLAYLEAHRGYTHSAICLPLLALVCVVVVAAIFRQRLPWRNAWLLCCAGVGSHLLIDWTNSYGVRLLLPFSSRWFHLDWNSLYDGYIWAVLGFAALWPWFARLVSREIGARPSSGRGLAVFALAFFVLFDGGRAALHGRAVAQLESRLYDGAPPVIAAALPEPFSPIHWTGVIETAGEYQVLPVDSLAQLYVQGSAHFYKPPVSAVLEHAEATNPFRYFVYFARFPVWSFYPAMVNGRLGTRVDLTDLRFGTPGHGSFHCVALEDGETRVLGSWFTFGSGQELGWGDSRVNDQ